MRPSSRRCQYFVGTTLEFLLAIMITAPFVFSGGKHQEQCLVFELHVGILDCLFYAIGGVLFDQRGRETNRFGEEKRKTAF